MPNEGTFLPNESRPLETPIPGEAPRLAVHEALELHELLNFKTVGIVKAKFASGLVFDQELKALLEKSVRQSMVEITELEGLYRNIPQLQWGEWHDEK